MVVVKDCSIDVLHLIILGILIDFGVDWVVGIGRSVALYIARIRVLLEDGGLLHMIWSISWSVVGYVAGIMIKMHEP